MQRVANWKVVSRPWFDTTAFAAAHPDPYSTFVSETRSRRFVLL